MKNINFDYVDEIVSVSVDKEHVKQSSILVLCLRSKSAGPPAIPAELRPNHQEMCEHAESWEDGNARVLLAKKN